MRRENSDKTRRRLRSRLIAILAGVIIAITGISILNYKRGEGKEYPIDTGYFETFLRPTYTPTPTLTPTTEEYSN